MVEACSSTQMCSPSLVQRTHPETSDRPSSRIRSLLRTHLLPTQTSLAGHRLVVHVSVDACHVLVAAIFRDPKGSDSLCKVVRPREGLVTIVANVRALLGVRSDVSLKML